MKDAVWDGWWVVRWGQRLVHIEADGAEDAVHGSIEALQGLGDWTGEPSELTAFPYIEYGKHAEPMEFTRAVIDRSRRSKNPQRRRRTGGRRKSVVLLRCENQPERMPRQIQEQQPCDCALLTAIVVAVCALPRTRNAQPSRRAAVTKGEFVRQQSSSLDAQANRPRSLRGTRPYCRAGSETVAGNQPGQVASRRGTSGGSSSSQRTVSAALLSQDRLRRRQRARFRSPDSLHHRAGISPAKASSTYP